MPILGQICFKMQPFEFVQSQIELNNFIEKYKSRLKLLQILAFSTVLDVFWPLFALF